MEMYEDLEKEDERLAAVRIHSVTNKKSLLNETSLTSPKKSEQSTKDEQMEKKTIKVPKIFYGKL